MCVYTILPASDALYAVDFALFPDHRPGEQIMRDASPLSPQTSFSYGYSTLFDSDFIEFGAGAELPFFTVTDGSGYSFTGGGYGVILSLFEPVKNASNFIHADYKIGGFNQITDGRWVFELNLFHVSSHLGDDYMMTHGAATENVGYESAEIFVSCMLSGEQFSVTPGAGYEHKFGRRPDNLIFYTQSIYLALDINFYNSRIPLRLNSILEIFNINKAPNTGIRLSCPLHSKVDRAATAVSPFHELFLSVYSGYSKQGFFSDRYIRRISGGFSMRL